MPVEHDNAKQNVGGGGGGGSGTGFPYNGSGDPNGVVTAAQGSGYIDTTNGGIYFRLLGTGTINTGWVEVGGYNAGSTPPSGVYVDTGGLLAILGNSTGFGVVISDTISWATSGVGNGIFYNNTATDGQQSIQIFLGSTSQYSWLWDENGQTQLPDMANSGSQRNTSASNPTSITFTSGTGRQVDTTHDRFLFVDTSTAGTVAIALSTDGSTYQTVGTRTVGATDCVSLYVPGAWYVKLTATTATLGSGYYY